MNFPDKVSVKWPKMNDATSWSTLEERVAGQLTDWYSSVDRKIRSLETILYSEAKELFGVVDQKKTPFVSRRQKEILSWRGRLNELKVAWKRAGSDDERTGIDFLQDECKEKIRVLKRAECARKRRWRRRGLRAKFFRDPYETARAVLKPKVSCNPNVTKSQLNEFVISSSADPSRDVPLGPLDNLNDVNEISTKFNTAPFSFKTFELSLKRKRNGSKPGPNKIPYKVYKKCPRFASFIFDIMQAVRRKGVVPLRWRIAEGFFLPKVDKPDKSNLSDFRTISLMNGLSQKKRA